VNPAPRWPVSAATRSRSTRGATLQQQVAANRITRPRPAACLAAPIGSLGGRDIGCAGGARCNEIGSLAAAAFEPCRSAMPGNRCSRAEPQGLRRNPETSVRAACHRASASSMATRRWQSGAPVLGRRPVAKPGRARQFERQNGPGIATAWRCGKKLDGGYACGSGRSLPGRLAPPRRGDRGRPRRARGWLGPASPVLVAQKPTRLNPLVETGCGVAASA